MNKEIIAQAKKEIKEENKKDAVNQAKNILRQIDILRENIIELEIQLSEL